MVADLRWIRSNQIRSATATAVTLHHDKFSEYFFFGSTTRTNANVHSIDVNSDFQAFRLQIGEASKRPPRDTKICLKFNHQFGSPSCYMGRSRNNLSVFDAVWSSSKFPTRRAGMGNFYRFSSSRYFVVSVIIYLTLHERAFE